MKKPFRPEQRGMVFCPVCNGRGKLRKSFGSFDICSKCGGFGLLKEISESSKESEVLRLSGDHGQGIDR